MERPKFIPPLKNADKALNIAAFAALASLWAMVAAAYGNLPDVIPTHFNLRGEADAYGNPGSIFTAPVLASALFLLLSLVIRYPHKMNYTMEITPENANYQYSMAARMLRYLRFSIVLLFIILEYCTILEAHNQRTIGGWVIGVIMVLIHFPVFFFMINMSSHGETK